MTPYRLVRGTGGEEKVLKNAKDACASEALEIATYTALERLAHFAGDERTATPDAVATRSRQISDRLANATDDRINAVLAYKGAHKNRRSVLGAAKRERAIT